MAETAGLRRVLVQLRERELKSVFGARLQQTVGLEKPSPLSPFSLGLQYRFKKSDRNQSPRPVALIQPKSIPSVSFLPLLHRSLSLHHCTSAYAAPTHPVDSYLYTCSLLHHIRIEAHRYASWHGVSDQLVERKYLRTPCKSSEGDIWARSQTQRWKARGCIVRLARRRWRKAVRAVGIWGINCHHAIVRRVLA